MIIKKVTETPIIETPHKLDVRRLYDKDSAQVAHIKFEAGESLKPHITPVDVFFYVLEGSLDILVGEEKITVGSDSLVESPKNIVHCLYNNSNKVARVLVVKAPKPTSSTKLL